MSRHLVWTAAIVLASLAAWLTSCTLELAKRTPDDETLTFRTEVYGPANPRSAIDVASPATLPETFDPSLPSARSDELDVASSSDRDNLLADDERIEVVIRGAASPRAEPDPEARIADWLDETDRRTQAAVLRAKLRQLDELLEMLEAAELSYLESAEATAPGATPLDRRLDLFRELRRSLTARRQSLQQSLNPD